MLGVARAKWQDNTAPLYWPLGRVTKVYFGEDGLVRVVKIKMKDSEYKRPIVKLAPLPFKSHDETDSEEIQSSTQDRSKKIETKRAKDIKTRKSGVHINFIAIFFFL